MIDLTVAKLDKALELTETRKQLIAQNIGKGDKAPESPLQANFSETLANVQSESELARVGVITTSTPGATEINLDQEMLGLSTNAMEQQSVVKALNSKLQLVNMAIKGDK